MLVPIAEAQPHIIYYVTVIAYKDGKEELVDAKGFFIRMPEGMGKYLSDTKENVYAMQYPSGVGRLYTMVVGVQPLPANEDWVVHSVEYADEIAT